MKRSVVIDAVRLRRKEISEDTYYKNLVDTFGKEVFEEVIQVMDNDVPE